MAFYTYVLYSEGFDRFYYGQTGNLHSRLEKHNSGKVPSTATYLPWCLYAYKEFDSRSEAFIMEKKLKNLKSRLRVSDFIKSNGFIVIL